MCLHASRVCPATQELGRTRHPSSCSDSLMCREGPISGKLSLFCFQNQRLAGLVCRRCVCTSPPVAVLYDPNSGWLHSKVRRHKKTLQPSSCRLGRRVAARPKSAVCHKKHGLKSVCICYVRPPPCNTRCRTHEHARCLSREWAGDAGEELFINRISERAAPENKKRSTSKTGY